MQAREIFKAVPKGNYVIIKGNEADNNARFLRGGYEEIIGAAVTAGDIKIVGETFTDGWKPDIAQTNMEGIPDREQQQGRRRSLRERRHGRRRRSRRSPPRASTARCRSPARTATRPPSTTSPSARQTVSVWKDARELGKAAGEAAIQLCKDKDVTKVANTAPFTTPKNNTVTSQLLKPHPGPQGQPQRRRRRRLDHQGRPVQGRHRQGPSPPAADPSNANRRPAASAPPRGRAHSSPRARLARHRDE